MDDNIQQFVKPSGKEFSNGNESKIFDVSVKGWIVIMMSLSLCCVFLFRSTQTIEALFSNVIMFVLGHYFGNRVMPVTTVNKTQNEKINPVIS